jgi:hypothetical protein
MSLTATEFLRRFFLHCCPRASCASATSACSPTAFDVSVFHWPAGYWPSIARNSVPQAAPRFHSRTCSAVARPEMRRPDVRSSTSYCQRIVSNALSRYLMTLGSHPGQRLALGTSRRACAQRESHRLESVQLHTCPPKSITPTHRCISHHLSPRPPMHPPLRLLLHSTPIQDSWIPGRSSRPPHQRLPSRLLIENASKENTLRLPVHPARGVSDVG